LSFEELDNIVSNLEISMTDKRYIANQPLSEKDIERLKVTPNTLLDSNILRNQVWENYYKDRKDRICSRCGSYQKYKIIDDKYPTAHELNSKYGYDFYLIEYKLEITEVRNINSLGDATWGNVCNKCKDHVLGIKPYLLDSSLSDIEFELRDLRNKESNRRLFQEDKIKAAKTKANKERREALEGK